MLFKNDTLIHLHSHSNEEKTGKIKKKKFHGLDDQGKSIQKILVIKTSFSKPSYGHEHVWPGSIDKSFWSPIKSEKKFVFQQNWREHSKKR